MSQPRSSKVMLIGLDGLTLQRLLPLAAAGKLPTFSRLLQTGAHGELRSVTNMTTGPTWAAFSTGCTPERHGIYHDFHHRADSYQLEATTGRDRQVAPLWQVASAAGRRVIVLNVPMSYPVQTVNGVILAGIDAPSERAPGFAHPPDAYRALKQTGIDYIIDCGLASYMQTERLEAGWAAVAHETEARTQAAEHLLAQTPWDLFVTVYSLPDVWQHYFWSAPPGSPGAQRIEAAYELVDAHLARLLRLLPDDGAVVICSDHGFGPLHGTRDAVNQWLATQGLLHFIPAGQERLGTRFFRWLRRSARRHASFRLRQQLLAAFAPLRRQVESSLRIGQIDFSQTQVYAAIDHLELWVNLRGRQPHGCVDPHDRMKLCEQVKAQLQQWRDPVSGDTYVRQVTINAPTPTSGERDRHVLPDLSLDWNPRCTLHDLHPLITGDHAPDGAVLLAGPGVPTGIQSGMALIDIAPLVLKLLAIPAPAYMQGNAPTWLENPQQLEGS
jgi:predicted AlkP superfamily phosphohydrolase/phosphomutase